MHKQIFSLGKNIKLQNFISDKICVCTIVHNEIEILPYTLPQSLKFADQVIVLDGGPEGTSNDGTYEYLKSLNHKHLYLETGTFNSDHSKENNWNRLMRQRYLDLLKQMNWSGWMLVVDADETYTDKDWEIMKEATKKDDILLYRFPFYHFFIETNLIMTGGIWDKKGHRLSVYKPYFLYKDNSVHLCDTYGKYLSNKKEVGFLDIHTYHYGHAMRYQKEKQKYFRYLKREDCGKEISDSLPKNIDEWEWEDNRSDEIEKGFVKEFQGEHPQHMQTFLKNRHFNLI